MSRVMSGKTEAMSMTAFSVIGAVLVSLTMTVTACAGGTPVGDPRTMTFKPVEFTPPEPARVVLDNGMVVYLLEDHELPLVSGFALVRTGNLLVVSGQLCFDLDGKLVAKGKLGGGVSIEQGNAAARACAVNLLAQLKAALGDLDKVVRVVRLGGFINSAPDFLDGPKVMNGASDLMVAVFGDLGRSTRSCIGVQELYAGMPFEVETQFEIAD